MSNKYFIVLAGNVVNVRVASNVERMYAQVAEALREEDVRGLAIPMNTSRLAQGVWVQFQIPGVGTVVCHEEILAQKWEEGFQWRKKMTTAEYGGWGDEDAMDALREAVRAEFNGDFLDWDLPEWGDSPDWE